MAKILNSKLFALFPRQDDIKKYVSNIHVNMSGKTLCPEIIQAQKFDVLPCVGKEFLNWVFEQVEAQNQDDEFLEMLELLKGAIAYFAAARLMKESESASSDSGNVTKFGSNFSSSSQKQFNTTYWHRWRTGWDFLECLVWDCLCENKEYFSVFHESEAGKKCCAYFLNSPGVFHEYHPLKGTGGRMEDYMAFLPIMNEIECYIIQPILCKSLFEDLKNKICNNDELEDCEKELLKHIRFVIAAYVADISASKLGNKITARGLTTFYANVPWIRPGFAENKSFPDYRGHQHLDVDVDNTQATALRCLVNLLKNNPEKFALWHESECNPENKTDEDGECCTCQQTPCGCQKVCVSDKHGTKGTNTNSMWGF